MRNTPALLGQLITSAVGLWLVSPAVPAGDSAQDSSTCLQPTVPRAECAVAPPLRNCQEPVLLLGPAAKGSLRALSKTGGLPLAFVTYN